MIGRFAASVAVLTALLATGSAQGELMSFSGFEDPPYSTGSVGGQDGWTVTGTVSAASIVTVGPDHSEPPLVGAQSLYMKGSGFARHTTATQNFFDGISLKWRQQITGGDWNTTSLNNTVGGGHTFLQVEFNSGGNIFALTSGGNVDIGDYVLGDVYEVTATLDFTTGTYDVLLNNMTTANVTSASGLAFADPTTISDAGGELLLRMRSGGLYDSVQFVPEPGAIVLLSMGIPGAFILRKGRRAGAGIHE